MLTTKLTAATLAVALALVPATQAAADKKDFLAGAVLGGVAGALIQKQVQTQRDQQRLRARTVAPQYAAPRVYAPQRRAAASAPKKVYRPSIPATEEGRKIQASLNYFGFDAGTVDGKVGTKTRAAVEDYQRYMGYQATGTLTPFEQELLTTSWLRAQASGNTSFRQAAGLADGTKGLLKLYRADIAAGGAQQRSLPDDTVEPSSYATDI